jgi:hypothetical protein
VEAAKQKIDPLADDAKQIIDPLAEDAKQIMSYFWFCIPRQWVSIVF